MIGNQVAEDLRRCCEALEADNKRLRALLAERDALREALLWNSAALLSYVSAADDEYASITMMETGAKKRFGEILDMADAALEQEQGGSDD